MAVHILGEASDGKRNKRRRENAKAALKNAAKRFLGFRAAFGIIRSCALP